MVDSTASRRVRLSVCALAIALAVSSVAMADMDSARSSLAAGDYDSAVTDLDALLEQSPDNAEARFLKGLALARSGDTDGALSVFNSLVEDEPRMAEAWNNLGVLRARDGNLAGARDALEQATRIDPRHGPAQENLADIYVALARDAYERAGELESDNAIARTKAQQLAAFIGSSQGEQGGQNGANGSADNAMAPAASDADRGSPGSQPTATDMRTPEGALERWAQLWSAQDVDGYLAMYSANFVPDDGATRSAWAAQRRERVSAPASIDVSLRNIDVSRRGDQALVRFDQRYQSNTYQDQETKAVLMTESADGWKIVREGSADTVDFTAATSDSSAAAASDGRQPDVAAGSSQPPTGDEGGPARLAGANGQRSAPAEMQAASRTQAERNAVRASLEQWAAAWSGKDMQSYLNAYSDNYNPADGQTRIGWIQSRRSALNDPQWIRVELSDIDISMLNSDRALATFNQHYRSNAYEDRERKTTTLVHEDGGWRIIRES